MKQTSKLVIIITAILSFLISTAIAKNNNQFIVKQMDRVSPEYETRVVGGYEVPRGERTFQVALLSNGQQICGGSIISDQWVMTAAHCVDGTNVTQILSDTQTLNQGGQRHQVADIKIHENWNPNNLINGNDIALIRIDGNFDPDLERVKLATRAITNNIQTAIVSGWGLTSGGGRGSNQLREAAQTIISDNECERLQSGSMNKNSIICTYDQGIKSSCNGDSGGPLTAEHNGVTHSIGIVSYGPRSCTEYSAYTQTDNYTQWIKNYINNNSTTPENRTCPSDYQNVSGVFDSDGFIVLNNKYYYAKQGIHSYTNNNKHEMYLYKWNNGWKNIKSSTSSLRYKGTRGYYLLGLKGQPNTKYNICKKTP